MTYDWQLTYSCLEKYTWEGEFQHQQRHGDMGEKKKWILEMQQLSNSFRTLEQRIDIEFIGSAVAARE